MTTLSMARFHRLERLGNGRSRVELRLGPEAVSFELPIEGISELEALYGVPNPADPRTLVYRLESLADGSRRLVRGEWLRAKDGNASSPVAEVEVQGFDDLRRLHAKYLAHVEGFGRRAAAEGWHELGLVDSHTVRDAARAAGCPAMARPRDTAPLWAPATPGSQYDLHADVCAKCTAPVLDRVHRRALAGPTARYHEAVMSEVADAVALTSSDTVHAHKLGERTHKASFVGTRGVLVHGWSPDRASEGLSVQNAYRPVLEASRRLSTPAERLKQALDAIQMEYGGLDCGGVICRRSGP